MAEDKETNFRVTDRRKFNPDGSPRDVEDEMAERPATGAQAASQEAAAQQAPAEETASSEMNDSNETAGDASDNVVSFEAAKKKDRPEPQAEQPKAEQPKSEPNPLTSEQKQAAAAAERAYKQTNTGRASHMVEPNFVTLIDLLAAQAAMFLGIAEAPDGRQLPVDLEAARHFIDMLGVLEQKTKDSATADEAEMLESVLAYLRMQFVALSRKR